MYGGDQYGEQIMQNAAVAVGNGTAIECSGFNTCTMQVTGITSATITWECTLNGTTWVGLLVAPVTTGTAALTATADGLYRVDCSGLRQIRARISTWVSGTITVRGRVQA